MTIFVTGATGFLGGHFLGLRPVRGVRLRCLTRRRENPRLSGVEWVRGDLLHHGAWERKMRGCAAVVHLAAHPLLDCERDPVQGARVIVEGFSRLLGAARRAGVRRFVIASSAEVYGSPVRLPISEKTPLRPLSVYGFLKACADLHLLRFGEVSGSSVCILRFFNLYGCVTDGTVPVTVVRLFAERLLRDEPVILHASRRNSRDFIHVQDAARVVWSGVRRSSVRGVFNIGSGRETSLLNLATKLARLAGRRLRVDFRPAEGRLRRLVADCRRARELLGFRPKVSLDHGLREVLREVGR